jgi:UDP-MurNAc hydroxylase
MKFTILSHAGLLVEHHGVRIVCDPWLIGSCYWRSWWNFPEPDPQLIANLRPNFVYLTHLHWDHFHGPSLKKLFEPRTTILVPKVPTLRMVEDLRWLGFDNVVEIPHGKRVPLGPDFELRSYQFGLAVDSGALISGGGYTLFNCNDCKFFGLPLKQILNNHPKIDFVFRSHSSASPVPHCVENGEQLLPVANANYDSADQFARCALYTRARYAIPFASNHCFLHPETKRFNATATTPEIAQKRYASIAQAVGVSTECVVMPPGSHWSDTDGFKIAAFDFSHRDAYVEAMAQRHSEKLSAQLQTEAAAIADFAAFQSYFQQFLEALPWFIRRWHLPMIVFRVKDVAGTHHWCVDPKARLVTAVDTTPPEVVVFEVHATVLNDCTKLKMFSSWTASKRLRIHLSSADALRHANLWFTLLDLYEVDLLPLRKNFLPRTLAVRIRRWREPVEVAAILLKRLLSRQRFSVSRIYPLEEIRKTEAAT